MIRPAQKRWLLILAYFIGTVLSIQSQAQSKRQAPKAVKEHLLATLSFSDGDVAHLFSLWQIPLAASGNQGRITTDNTGKPAGIEMAPTTAFVLVDGTLASPFSGSLAWVLKTTESTLRQDLIVITGNIAWHAGEQRAYVTLSHSGASWARLQVFQIDIKKSLGTYSPVSTPRDDAVLSTAPSDTKPFAEWKTDSLSQMELFEVTGIQTVIEPKSLLIQLLDAQSLKPTSGLKGTMYLRLNLKDGTIAKAAE